MLVVPLVDGSTGTPTSFDARAQRGPARRLALIAVERLAGDLVWLRYRRRR
ncbi:Hypothetical protein I5071_50030 [Sandaracinus amylolyticus]|nr:Hypothetical protein I5071_50030 [Sandaracinus amylolyticus]